MIKFDGITEDKNCIGEDVLKYEKQMRNLPKELDYVEVSDGFAIAQPNSDIQLRFNGTISDELKEKIGGDITNLDEYMYNAQKPLPVEKVYAGDRELSKESLIIAPFKDLGFKKIFIMPNKFSKDDYWESNVYIAKKKIKVKFIRSAYDGIGVKRYIGQVDKGFKIILEFLKNGKLHCEIKFSISNVRGINDVLKIGEYMSNVRTLKINDFKLGVMFNDLDNELLDVVEFWRKVKVIGKVLKKRFSYKNNILVSDVENVNDLYKCLIEKKFCKDEKSAKYLNFKSKLNSIDDLPKSEKFCLIAVSESELEVLGKKIKVFTECIFIDYKCSSVSEKTENGIGGEICIEPDDSSIILERCFTNEEERDKYHSDIIGNKLLLNDIIGEFTME